MTDFERMRVLIRQEERYRWAVEKQMAKAAKSTTSISPTGGMGGSTRATSRVEDGAIMLAALKDEYAEIQEELEEARKELKESISRIRNAKKRLDKTCLRMRYLQGMSIRRIALSLNYSEDYLHRRMREAEAMIITMQRAQNERKTRQARSDNS